MIIMDGIPAGLNGLDGNIFSSIGSSIKKAVLKPIEKAVVKPVAKAISRGTSSVVKDPKRALLALSSFGVSEAYYRSQTVRKYTKEYGLVVAATAATIATGGAAAPALAAAVGGVVANEIAKKKAEDVADDQAAASRAVAKAVAARGRATRAAATARKAKTSQPFLMLPYGITIPQASIALVGIAATLYLLRSR